MKFLKGFLNIAVGAVFTLVAVLLALIKLQCTCLPDQCLCAVIFFSACFYRNVLSE